tara:strand:+ start:6576 stop:10139 length:3564 start_codon:yes stop_codon:yes gene_type:complete
MSDNTRYINQISNAYLDKQRAQRRYEGAPRPIKISMPGYVNNLFKEAYNKSTYGLVDQIINKKERYDLSNFEQGTLFDVGSTALALVLDLPTFFVGGAAAKIGVGGITKTVGKKKVQDATNQVTKILAENGARPAYVNRVNKQLTETFITKGDRLINEAGGLGIVSGTHDMLHQKIEKEDVDFAQAINASLVGAASIGFGKFGKVAGTNIVGNKAPSMLRTTLGTAGEVVGFTQPYTFQQGRLLPSPQDLAFTAGILGGVKVLGGGLSGIGKSISGNIEASKRKFGNRALTTKEKQLRDEILEAEAFNDLGKPQIFFNQDGGVKVIRQTKRQVEFTSLDGTVTQKLYKNKFYKEYGLARGKDAPVTQLDKIIKDGRKEFPDLKIKDDLNKMNPEQKYQQVRLIEGARHKSNLEQQIKAMDIEKKIDNNIFNRFHTFRTETLPTFFNMRYSPFASPESTVSRKGALPGAKEALKLLDDYQIEKDAVLGEIYKKHNISLKELAKLSEKDKVKLTEQLELLPDNQLDDIGKKLRGALTDMYEQFAKIDPNIAPFIAKYAMRDLRFDVKDKLTELRMSLLKERPGLDDAVRMGREFTKDEAGFLKQRIEKEIKNNSNTGVREYLSFIKETSGDDFYRAYLNIRNDLNSVHTKTFHNLKKGRDTYIYWDKKLGKYSKDIFETDGVVNFINYANTWADQIARTKFLGVGNKRIEDRIRNLELKGDQLSANVLTDVLIRATGAIETMPYFNYSPGVKNFYRNATQWQITTKIAGGTATLANVFQPMISSLLGGNYAVGVKSYIKTFVDKNRQKTLKDAGIAGNSNIQHMEVLSGLRPGETIMEKIAMKATQISGFNFANRMNTYTAASIGVDMMQYLNNIAMGKSGLFTGTGIPKSLRDKIRKETTAGKAREAWAKDKLQNDYGIIFNSKDLTTEQLTRGAIRYSRDTQLLRNHTKELLWMTHPKFRPFVVLKSFPLKQAKFIKDQLRNELAYGNVMPVMRLAVAANVGGTALLHSYDFIQKKLSGRDDYDFRNAENVIDRIAAVGAMGIMGDFLAAESKMQNLRFTVTPVIMSDIEKLWTATSQLINESGDYGVAGASRRSITRYSRILGSNMNNLAKRAESAEQTKGKLKYQRTKINKQIIELVYQGRDKKARQVLTNWNTANPDYPILEPSVADVYDLIRKKNQKRSKELQ